MTARDLAPLAGDRVVELLEQLVAINLRIARAVEAIARQPDGAGELEAALREFFGDDGATFSASGVIAAANEDPHAPLASALRSVSIDAAASLRGQAIQLALILKAMPAVETVDQHRGASLYALRK